MSRQDPGDEMVTPAPGHGRLRASHSDREQVADVLKAASGISSSAGRGGHT